MPLMKARFATAKARIKRMNWLLRINEEQARRIDEGMKASGRKAELMTEANNQKNAVGTLQMVYRKTNGSKRPEFIAQALQTDSNLKAYNKIIQSHLRILGFGEILENEGIEKALITAFQELEKAQTGKK